MHRLLATLILAAVCAYGGQSLSNTSAAVQNPGFPPMSKTSPVRAEMYFHDWPATPSAQTGLPCLTHAAGFYCQFTSNNYLNIQSYWSATTVVFQIPLANLPALGLYVRWQHDPTGPTETVEAWDTRGNRVYYNSQSLTNNSDNGGGVMAGGASTGVGFFRIHSTLVAVNSRPPVTADNTNTVLHWKFDGNLADSAPGGAYPASGTAGYMTTPNQNVIAKTKTYNAPQWTDWVSLRAGHWNQLDGSASFSQSDTSAAVTYTWTQKSGAYAVKWDPVYNQTSPVPKIRGLVFGPYTFTLTVSDGTNSDQADLELGAVATDDNGVVVNGDPNADKIFGPMIAFGKNPWGYMDERQRSMIGLQSSYLSGWNDPVWLHTGAGTVSYPFSGVGMWYAGATGTSLTGAVSTSVGATIPVADASKLSLGSLPTWIVIGNLSSGAEIVRVCSTTATTGAATLTPCYNGRALTMSPDAKMQSSTIYSTPHAWASGTTVGELRIQGSGTSFASDAATPICPAGIPGPPGPVVYSTGMVSLAANSTTITGIGTTWSGNVSANQVIRISATHGGAAFVYWATITSVTDATHLVVDRPLPADVDGGPFTYSITKVRLIALHFGAPNGSDQQLRYGSLGCESETAAFAMPYYDISGVNTVYQSGKKYSYKDNSGDASAFGPNFYGTGLASRAFYLRSGYAPALDVANRMDNKWVKSPEVAGGYAGGNPLLLGGGAIGAMANVILNPSAQIGWNDVRRFFELGNIGSWGCNDDDTRDTGYYGAWTALGALFDPDSLKRATWKSNLGGIYTRDNTCKSQGKTGLAVETNSWAESGYRWSGNNGTNAVTFTNGSKIGTGSNIASSVCYGGTPGTLAVAANSAAVTGSGFTPGNKIWINGTKGGQPFTETVRFTYNSPASITLMGLWSGDSGTASYLIESSDWLTAWAQNQNSASLAKNYACTWNSSTQITLDRSWESTSGTYYAYSYTLAGYGTQPYMLGIKTTMMGYASQVDDPTLAANYSTLAGLAATWIHDYGINPSSGGPYYARVFSACEPPPAPTTVSASGVYVTPGCNSDGGMSGERVLIGEISSALRAFYKANPVSAAKDWGDQIYGSLWGYTPWNTGGVYSDSHSIGNAGGYNTTNNDLGSYKWPGFFFGMGMAHQWPAVRLGGVQPASNLFTTLTHNLGSVPGATSAVASVTAPSGAVTQTACGATTCQITVDERQGDHWVQVSYWNGQTTVAQDSPVFIGIETVNGATPTTWSATMGGKVNAAGRVVVH